MFYPFFQTLESVAYEISIDFHKVRGPGSKEGISVRLFMVLMSTIAKLASRCQDLIPRTLLCLKKIAEASSVSGGTLEPFDVVDPFLRRESRLEATMCHYSLA